MTDQTKINTSGRAQIFALLRENEPEQAAPVRPTYLTATVADEMIHRAKTSFSAPPQVNELAVPARHHKKVAPMPRTPIMRVLTQGKAAI